MSLLKRLGTDYPEGYWPLYGSEIISRFGFWTIQSLLVLYLIRVFNFSEPLAYSFFASYSALTYAVTIAGGIIADKLIGFKQPVLIGGWAIFLGSLILSVPHIAVVRAGLSLVILGTGLMIPNIATFIGALYRAREAERDKGFSTFYIATNLGGLGGPLIGGLINQYFGWAPAFISVALFMLIWFTVYFYNRDRYRIFTYPTHFKAKILAYTLMLIIALANNVLLKYQDLLGYLFTLIFCLSLVYIFFSERKNPQIEFKMLGFIVVCILLALYFFTFEFQILTSFIIFTDTFVRSEIWGFHLPVSTIVAIEPLFVVVLIPILNKLFVFIQANYRLITQFEKIIYALFSLGLCFLVFALAAKYALVFNVRLSLLWVIGALILMAIGEVLIMPPLLSAITKEAPENLKATLIGVLYLAISLSGYLSGQVAKLTAVWIGSGSQGNHMGYYQTYSLIALLSGLLAIGLWIGYQRVRQ